MLFNSLHFLIFFPLVVVGYMLVPVKYRWGLLLAASYYFYMSWNPAYLLLIVFSTLVDYYCAIKMEKAANIKNRKRYLLTSLISNLGLLFVFKYFDFFNHTIAFLGDIVQINYAYSSLNLLLPVGISFYTFQTLSYTIDVYRGNKRAEKHFGIFALYVSFFPQLVAGPIERSTRLLPQLKATSKSRELRYNNVTNGLKLMAWGLFKKVVIADRVAYYVNAVYGSAAEFTGMTVILATIFFAFQIYCDFSGYSDIAIGAAQVLGFNLMKNFDRPYFSKSISEFWKRWHISLSTWFRDYVYIPLGGNRTVKWKWYYNLFITFLVSGLWHGANWTFVVWGAMHGIFLITSIITSNLRATVKQIFAINKNSGINKLWQISITFALVTISWVFFRADSVNDAILLLQNATHLDLSTFGVSIQGFNREEIMASLVFIGGMELIHFWQRGKDFRTYLNNKPIWFRWALYQLLILCIILFGVFEKQEFIYFQF